MKIIETLEKHLDKKAKIEYHHYKLEMFPRTYADVNNLIKDVGFKPDICVDEGIESVWSGKGSITGLRKRRV